MRYSTRFSCVCFLLLLFFTQSTKAQTQQTDEFAIAAARELAITNSKTIGILAESLFGSFFPRLQREKAAPLGQALTARLEEIYVEVATPILARGMTTQEMRFLTEAFKAPAFQTFMAALAESAAIWMPCMTSKLDALPVPQEAASEEQNRLARQLFALQHEANPAPPKTNGEPAHPRVAKKLQEKIDRSQEEWRKHSNCVDDGATAILAKRLTAEELSAMIALERSQPMQKLNSAMEEVEEQFGLRLVEEVPKIFGAR